MYDEEGVSLVFTRREGREDGGSVGREQARDAGDGQQGARCHLLGSDVWGLELCLEGGEGFTRRG